MLYIIIQAVNIFITYNKSTTQNFQKGSRVPVLLTDKDNSGTKKIIRDWEGNYIMIKSLILQEDIANLSVYISNNGDAKYFIEQKQIEMKRQINT